MPDRFHNPYSFVPPADPKGAGTYQADAPNPNEHPLGQGRPAGHDRYRPGLWSGRIHIAIEAATPLLIPETVPVAELDAPGGKHKVFRTRCDTRPGAGADTPLLPVTSFKGPLRAAYEAITNSRLGVFRGHGAPLARRMEAGEGLGMVPVRVVKVGNKLKAQLLVGTTQGWPSFDAGKRRWNAPQGPLYAAWLPFRGDRMLAKGRSYAHGAHVDVKLQLIQHSNPSFRFWEVVAIKGVAEPWEDHEKRRKTRAAGDKYAPFERDGGPVFKWGRGYVCRTNHNIRGKHDERVFFMPNDNQQDMDDGIDTVVHVDIGDAVVRRWRELIRDCQDLHRDEIKKRADDGVKPSAYVKAEGQNEDQPAFSRHTYENGAEELLDGTLAYVRLEIGPNLNAARLPTISDLFPVMIGRELGNWSSYELLAEGLRPAMSIDDLSPADRVFGWVRDETANTSGREGAPSDLKPPSAWKGQLRIAPIRCDTASAIQAVGDPENGLPLAILSTPKPAQARFYAAQDDTGKPFEDGADIRQKGYFERGSQKPKAGLRGRKVYPHHRAACAASVFASYWDATSAARDARTGRKLDPVPGSSGLYREYVRRATAQGAPQRDGQNRSVRDWVRPGTRFETHIDVMNLNAAELGALLWLLDLGRTQGGEPAAHLRLGGGKPLGFGSVRVTITAIDLADGEARRAEYRSLLGIPDAERAAQAQSGLRLLAKGDAVTEALAHLPTGTEHGARPAGSDPIHPVAAFKTAIAQACGKPGAFDEMPAIAAYLIAARGFADALPLHYARTGECADPEGKNYEWFVANQHPQRGRKLALPDIRTDTGLPRDLQR